MKINKSLLFATLVAAFYQTMPSFEDYFLEAASKPSLYSQIEENESTFLTKQGLSPLVQTIVEAQDYADRAELLLERISTAAKSLTPAETKLFKSAQDDLNSAIINFKTLYGSLTGK